YILNIVADGADGRLKPVYGVSGHSVTDEREVDTLPGYRGFGPVRIGNQAYRQVQHDVYGSAILAATHVFFDRRLVQRGGEGLFRRLEALGERAAQLFDQRSEEHTSELQSPYDLVCRLLLEKKKPGVRPPLRRCTCAP